jgi:5'-3' exonuclease
MKKLRIGLEKMISHKGRASWVLLSSDEPGEGEHKIMAEWRKGMYEGNYAVYGLDADLIVLSLLGQTLYGNRVWLFREEIDKGKMVYDSMGEEQFEWFSVEVLREWLSTGMSDTRAFMLNYCFAMSVLGNDFLPSSLGLKIREDGHAELLDHLRTTTESLVDPDSLIISNEGLLAFFQRLVTSEKDRITQYVTRKAKQVRSNLPVGHTDWPLACQDESILLAPDNRRQLARDWQSAYQNSFFPGWRTKECRETICTTYLYGIQWIWAYYTGATESVCFNWYYPHSLPPLWEWLTNYLTHKKIPVFPGEVLYRAADIRPVEQLALVLPMESWSLIPPCRERNFPFMAPAFFPSSFSFESVGKRFFWECEARIPIPNIQTLKMLFS